MISKRVHILIISSLICLVAVVAIFVLAPGKLSAQSQTTQQLFIGVDDSGDLQGALRNAVAKAQEAVGCCDRLVTFRLVEVQGQVGGIAGLNQIRVTIIASW